MAVAGLASLGGCAQSVGDIDRTQPNLLDKRMFEGKWYVRQTVVDVPFTSAFSFVGETGETEVIVWEVQEEMLVGYRAYEKVPGADPDADQSGVQVGDTPVAEGQGTGRDQTVFKDAPVVAYPILDHVDVQREYNAQTGEQTNVIVENTTDRPWYERDFVRVDWSKPQVTNFGFISSPADVRIEASRYVPADEGGPDAFRMEEDDDGATSYFDFTEHLLVQPDVNGCILNLFNNEVGDCAAAEIKVRTSFAKVDEARERSFAPQFYDDVRQGEFGYFRTERPTYDRRRGVTYSGITYLANIHDVWDRSVDDDGNTIPHADRDVRPIVYALSPGFPTELMPVTRELVTEFDATLKAAVAQRRGQTVEELETELRDELEADCLVCVDLNEDGDKRLGDLRHSFIAWVDDPQIVSPLGYGPSSANPETGRIVSGMAYVYGGAVDTYAQRAKDMVDLLRGDLVVDDLVSADYIRQEVATRRSPVDPRTQRLAEVPLEGGLDAVFGDRSMERLQALRTQGLPEARPGAGAAQLTRLQGTDIERRLIDQELVRAYGKKLGFDANVVLSGQSLDDDLLDLISPVRQHSLSSLDRRARLQRRAEQHNLWLADFTDPTVIGLAFDARLSSLTGDDLYQYLREQIYRAVMLHEIGHTFGLRHNFGGSADPINYGEEYWSQRVATIRAPESVQDLLLMNCSEVDATNEEACVDQLVGRMREYQYASIMDYGAKFNSDFHGLGRYDRAALAGVYADLTEVFGDDATEAMPDGLPAALRDAASLPSPIFGSLYDLLHYTDLPGLFGGQENLADRRFVAREEVAAAPGDFVPVPYLACYDEYVDATDRCHRWDEGADGYEITLNWIRAYDDYYAFHALSRDQVGFSPVDTFQRVTSRYFLPIQNMYQHGLFALSFSSGDPVRDNYQSLQMSAGFNHLWRVMSTPRYGSYVVEGGAFRWVSYAQGNGDISIPPGTGRREFSRYDYASGYNAYQRVVETGYYWDQLGALLALTNSDASRLGIGQDIDADLLSYSIPYYLLFAPQLDSLFADLYLDQGTNIGPYLTQNTDGSLSLFRRDLYYNGILEPIPAGGAPLDISVPWSTRIRAALYGMAFFKANFDLSFLQGAQVVLDGAGEPITPAAGYETVTFEDPLSGRRYLAYRDPNQTDRRWMAAEIVEGMQAAADRYGTLDPDDAAAADERAAIENFLRDGAEDLEILRALYQEFSQAL